MTDGQAQHRPDEEDVLTLDEQRVLDMINRVRALTIVVDEESPGTTPAKSGADEPDVHSLTWGRVREIAAAYPLPRTTTGIEQLLTELLGIEVRGDKAGQLFHILCGIDTKLARRIAMASDAFSLNWNETGNIMSPRDYVGEAVVVNLHLRALAMA